MTKNPATIVCACFAINNMIRVEWYFDQSHLLTQANFKTEIGTYRLFHEIKKRIKSGNCLQRLEAENGLKQQRDALTIHDGIIFRGVVPFILPKLRHLFRQKRMRHILGRMQLRHQSEWQYGVPAFPKTFNILLVNVRIVKWTGLASEKKSQLGRNPKLGNGSTWIEVMLRTKPIFR